MIQKSSLGLTAIACLAAAGLALGQEHVGQYSQAQVEAGFQLYNTNCVTCHGPDGDAVPGVNLRKGQFRRIASDADLDRLIQTGIPGTAMPSGRYTTSELAGLVAYVRAMHEYDARASTKGDAARGQLVFEGKGNCTTCHRVNGKGSRLGPDLSDVGALRALDALLRSLVDPNGSSVPVNRFVRAVDRNGKVITGRRLNEDTYTVQLIDTAEHLVSLTKANLSEYTVLKTSSMPSYKDTLTSAELGDVVAYLRTLKGSR
jgi:putative heme-binding domain-containing protein